MLHRVFEDKAALLELVGLLHHLLHIIFHDVVNLLGTLAGGVDGGMEHNLAINHGHSTRQILLVWISGLAILLRHFPRILRYQCHRQAQQPS